MGCAAGTPLTKLKSLMEIILRYGAYRHQKQRFQARFVFYIFPSYFLIAFLLYHSFDFKLRILTAAHPSYKHGIFLLQLNRSCTKEVENYEQFKNNIILTRFMIL